MLLRVLFPECLSGVWQPEESEKLWKATEMRSYPSEVRQVRMDETFFTVAHGESGTAER